MSLENSGFRIVLLLVSGMVAAALIASSATASLGRPPDVRDAAANVAASAATAGRPPDVRDAAGDVFERYAAAHRYGGGLAAAPAIPPDVSDAAAASRVSALPPLTGFHWAAYAAGIGTGIGSALILAGLLAAAMARRNRESLA